MWGGKRPNSGRPKKAPEEKAKMVSFRLYEGEKEKVKEFIKKLRANS